MKAISVLLYILSFSTSSWSQNDTSHRFTISGEIRNSNYPTVTLLYKAMDGVRIYDSVRLKKGGEFFFTGYVKEPSLAMLRNSPMMEDAKNPNTNNLFLEPGNITVNTSYDDFIHWNVYGSKSNIEYEDNMKQWKSLDRNSPNFSDQLSKIDSDFIKTNPNSYVSAYNLNYYRSRWPLKAVKSMYLGFCDSVRNGTDGQEIFQVIREIEDNSPGKSAKQFVAKDMNGKKLDLATFKNSYILLDFWASWCGPCRESTPRLLKWYKLYHQKGLEVIGITSDWDKKDWMKAVKKDGIGIWRNVLSEDSAVINQNKKTINNLYGVHNIPVKILIDKFGLIIGRYTGSDEDINLEKQLTSLFN